MSCRRPVPRRTRKLNPLRHIRTMIKLNPYASVLKRRANRSAEARVLAKEALALKKSGVSNFSIRSCAWVSYTEDYGNFTKKCSFVLRVRWLKSTRKFSPFSIERRSSRKRRSLLVTRRNRERNPWKNKILWTNWMNKIILNFNFTSIATNNRGEGNHSHVLRLLDASFEVLLDSSGRALYYKWWRRFKNPKQLKDVENRNFCSVFQYKNASFELIDNLNFWWTDSKLVEISSLLIYWLKITEYFLASDWLIYEPKNRNQIKELGTTKNQSIE